MSPSLRRVRRVPRAAAVVRLGATVLAAVTLLSCVRDQAPAPPTRAPGANPQHSTITTLGTYSIPIPAVNADGGAQPIASTGITVPAGTYYRVRVNGSVIVSPNPAHQAAYPGRSYDQAGTYGPGGTGQGAWDLLVLLKARNTDGSGTNNINIPNLQYGTTAPDSARSDIL